VTKRAINAAAFVFLAAAIAALVWALLESSKAGDIRGPGALVVAGDEVWIAVDDQLWRVTPQGHLKRRDVLTVLGVPGAPANLVRHPSGAIVATVRDDPTLYFLDPTSAQVTRKLQPAWPAELARHAGRAINLAFHQDGRFAIATGGGHAVALFDANGAFVARTSPDLYKFTNGLWWQGDELWTTDTNRFVLKRLDGATLALREERALPGRAGAVFLGPARAYLGPDGSTRAALIRFRNGMIVGRVVAIGTDGREAEFNHSATMEPNDVDWLLGELLASDGAAMTVWRWSVEREPLGAFGDAELRSEWGKLRQRQLALQAHHRIGLYVAIGTFAIGFALAVWAELRGGRAGRGTRTIDLSRLGTPRLSRGELMKLHWKTDGWMIFLVVPLLLVQWPGVQAWLKDSGGALFAIGLLAALMVAACVAMPIVLRHQKRLARDPAYEPRFNVFAVRKLASSHVIASTLREGEQVLETFTWMRLSPNWAVLTDERLLVFAATLFDAKLKASYPLEAVVAASAQPGALKRANGSGRKPWTARAAGSAGWLEIVLRNGEVIDGIVSAPTVADRVAAFLQQHAHRPVPHAAPPVPDAAPRKRGSNVVAAAASALIPGLGQWMQRRRAIALAMFVPWAVALVTSFIPLGWILAGPRMEVSARTVLGVVTVALAYAAFSAWDAWRVDAHRSGA
jgi:hypothetical protein